MNVIYILLVTAYIVAIISLYKVSCLRLDISVLKDRVSRQDNIIDKMIDTMPTIINNEQYNIKWTNIPNEPCDNSLCLIQDKDNCFYLAYYNDVQKVFALENVDCYIYLNDVIKWVEIMYD